MSFKDFFFDFYNEITIFHVQVNFTYAPVLCAEKYPDDVNQAT